MTYWSSSQRNGTPPSWHLSARVEKDECGDDCPYCKAWAEIYGNAGTSQGEEWLEQVYKDVAEARAEIADEPVTFEDAFNRIFDEAFDILVSKQEAYGPENIKELDFFGTFSRLASDKVNRIKNLMKGSVVNGTVYVQFPLDLEETVEDTLFDIMNYAAILISLRRNWWAKPLSKDVDFEGVGE